MNIDHIISELEKTLGSHASLILSSLSSVEKEKNPNNSIESLVNELECSCFKIASFYTDTENIKKTGILGQISQNFLLPQADDVKRIPEVQQTLDDLERMTSEQLSEIVMRSSSAIFRPSVIDALLETVNSNVTNIRKASLKRLRNRRSLERRRLISFGKLRAWTCEMMRKAGSGSTKPYETVSKCARLRRRLSRLFLLARASHTFSNRLVPQQNPLVARLNQDLMRIRLQLALRLKQPSSAEHPRFLDDPAGLSRRFEHVIWHSGSGVFPSKLQTVFDQLIDHITELVSTLEIKPPGLQHVFSSPESVCQEDLRALVHRSLLTFCNFYSNCVAPDLDPSDQLSFLSLLSNSESEADEMTPSDTEYMMDAFDVYDAFIENSGDSDEPNSAAMNTLIHSSSSSASNTPSSGRPASPSDDSDESKSAFRAASNVKDTSLKSPSAELALPVKLSSDLVGSTERKSTSSFSSDEQLSPDSSISEDEHEEGEVVDVEEEEEVLSDVLHEHKVENAAEVLSEIDQTEQAIMEEWAPLVGEKPQTKLSYDSAVQQALDEATKSCRRELHTMITLESSDLELAVSGQTLKDPCPRDTISPTVDREIIGMTASSLSLKGFPPTTLRYSRDQMLRIRAKVRNSLLRQRASKHAYWNLLRRR